MITVKTINTPFGPVTKIAQGRQIPLDIPEIARVEAVEKKRKKKEK